MKIFFFFFLFYLIEHYILSSSVTIMQNNRNKHNNDLSNINYQKFPEFYILKFLRSKLYLNFSNEENITNNTLKSNIGSNHKNVFLQNVNNMNFGDIEFNDLFEISKEFNYFEKTYNFTIDRKSNIQRKNVFKFKIKIYF